MGKVPGSFCKGVRSRRSRPCLVCPEWSTILNRFLPGAIFPRPALTDFNSAGDADGIRRFPPVRLSKGHYNDDAEPGFEALFIDCPGPDAPFARDGLCGRKGDAVCR